MKTPIYADWDRQTHTPAPLWGQWLVEQWHSAQEQSSLFGEDDSAQEQHQTGSLSPQSFSHQLAFEHQLGSPGAWCKGQKGNIGDGAYSFCVCFLCHSLCRLAIQDPLELCELTLIQGVLARLLQQTLHALDFSSHLAKGTSLCNAICNWPPGWPQNYQWRMFAQSADGISRSLSIKRGLFRFTRAVPNSWGFFAA